MNNLKFHIFIWVPRLNLNKTYMNEHNVDILIPPQWLRRETLEQARKLKTEAQIYHQSGIVRRVNHYRNRNSRKSRKRVSQNIAKHQATRYLKNASLELTCSIRVQQFHPYFSCNRLMEV